MYLNNINYKTLTDSLYKYAKHNECEGTKSISKHGFFEDHDYHNYGYLEFHTLNSFTVGLGYSRQDAFERNLPQNGFNLGVAYDFLHNTNIAKAGLNFSALLNVSVDAAIINNFSTNYVYMPTSFGIGGMAINLSYTRNFFLPKDNVFTYPLNQISLKILFGKNNFGWWVFDKERRD